MERRLAENCSGAAGKSSRAWACGREKGVGRGVWGACVERVGCGALFVFFGGWKVGVGRGRGRDAGSAMHKAWGVGTMGRMAEPREAYTSIDMYRIQAHCYSRGPTRHIYVYIYIYGHTRTYTNAYICIHI